MVRRGEWRGSDRSFTIQDRNDAGVLSGPELRGDRRRVSRHEWPSRQQEFDLVDGNGDGYVSRWELERVLGTRRH